MVVSAGAKHTLFNLAQVLYDHGDEVVIPVPAWGSYAEQARLCGAAPVLVPCTRARRLSASQPDALARALGPRTKAVVLCTPSNPTGAAYSARASCARWPTCCGRAACYVIVDEIYAELAYDGMRDQVAARARARPARAHRDRRRREQALCDDRLPRRLDARRRARSRARARRCRARRRRAWPPCASSRRRPRSRARRSRSSRCAPRSQRRRDLLIARLSRDPGAARAASRAARSTCSSRSTSCSGAAGLADDTDVANFLLERARVAVVPGSAFHAPGYVRLSYAASEAATRARRRAHRRRARHAALSSRPEAFRSGLRPRRNPRNTGVFLRFLLRARSLLNTSERELGVQRQLSAGAPVAPRALAPGRVR